MVGHDVPDGPGLSIVKLGGSVITRKQQAERLRPKVLARLSDELSSATGPLVVLHGAGSFGHPGAVRFGLARPPEPGAPTTQRARGASVVSNEVRRLHLAVLRTLAASGARTWSLPPATLATNREGRLERLDSGPFVEALENGFLPVAFGDVVPDAAWGRSILSADTIAVELVRVLHPRRVLYVSDVPGILEPPAPGPRRIHSRLDPELLASLSERTSGHDVTGGIRRKAAAMLEIARLGADAALISGLSRGTLARALRGEAVVGTWCPARAE